MIHDKIDDEPAQACPVDDNPYQGPADSIPAPPDDADGNPGDVLTEAANANGQTGGEALMARVQAGGPGAAEGLVVLIDALLTIGCHAVANIHPESNRDIPAEALDAAAMRLPLFYPDVTRAGEIAQVWAERATEVRRWRERRLARGSEPDVPATLFPAAIAGAYSQKVHGSPGVFETHDIGVDADGQPVVKSKAPVAGTSPLTGDLPSGPELSPAAERKLQRNLKILRKTMAPAFGGDKAKLDAYMRQVEPAARGVIAMTSDAPPTRKATRRPAKAATARTGKARATRAHRLVARRPAKKATRR